MPSRNTVSRRLFIKRTATAAGAIIAAPTLIPAKAIGADGATPPSETVTMGMIGTGRQCYQKNIPLFQRNPDARIIAACDVDSWRLAQAKKRIDDYNAQKHASLGGCDTTVDYTDILARDDIDAVMISTPDHWHAKMAIEAMDAGMHVALEKPIIRTIADGRRLVEASKKNNVVFRVDSEFRSGIYARRAYEIVRHGRLGKITKVLACVPESDIPCPQQPDMPVPPELDYKRWLGPTPDAPYTLNRVHPREGWGRPGWMRKLDYCDGMVTNWGTHLVNGTLWCLGLDRSWPLEIEATGLYPAADSFWNVPLKFDIKYTYPDLEIAYRTESPYLRIEGENGWVQAGFSSINASDQKLLEEKFEIADSPEPRYTSEKTDFIYSVKNGVDSLEPAEVGHHVTSTLLMGHIALNLGEKLKWDGTKERFVDNDKANAMLDAPITQPNPDLQAKA